MELKTQELELLQDHLREVAVIGAAGKMGRGIAYLVVKSALQVFKGRSMLPQVTFVDNQQSAFEDLKTYLMKLAAKSYARESELWSDYADEKAFLKDFEACFEMTTDMKKVKSAKLIFEAVPELMELKVDIFKELKGACSEDTLFLTNTSSIPIEHLQKESELEGRIVGFHFYNPPPVQKLVELIFPQNTNIRSRDLSLSLVKLMNKEEVISRDIAGFIGNGHFIREALAALRIVDDLQKEFTIYEGLYYVNAISELGLVRPMGIFQTLDYIGLDVFDAIVQVMREFGDENLPSKNLMQLILRFPMMGGQNPDGSQRDGLFQYEERQIRSVLDIHTGEYTQVPTAEEVQEALGDLQPTGARWSSLVKDQEAIIALRSHFGEIMKVETRGAKLCLEYLNQSRTIAGDLVLRGVCGEILDVHKVLKMGFHHLYGPLENWLDDYLSIPE